MLPIGDSIPRKSPPISTWLIILANSFVFFCELGMPGQQLERFFYLFGLVPARYTYPEWAAAVGLPFNDYLPFLTNMFLHEGWLHIILNMWALWIFGDNVEDAMGHIRYAIFYILGGFAATASHAFFSQNDLIPAIGASGAISAVLGAYIVLFPRATITAVIPIFFFFPFEVPALFLIGIWFVMQLVNGIVGLTDAVGGGGLDACQERRFAGVRWRERRD